MADRIVVMRNGAIQQIGAPDRLFSEPATGWVADFVNAGNLISGDIIERTPGQWSIELAAGTVFAAAKNPTIDRKDAVLLVPFHKMRVEKAAGDSPFFVTASHPIGLAVDLHIANGIHVFRAQLPIERMAEFPTGTPVLLSGGPDGGTWLPRE